MAVAGVAQDRREIEGLLCSTGPLPMHVLVRAQAQGCLALEMKMGQGGITGGWKHLWCCVRLCPHRSGDQQRGRKDRGLLCMKPSRGMRTSDIPLAGDQCPAPVYRAGFDLDRARCWGHISAGRGGALAGSVTRGGRGNLLLCWLPPPP